MDSLSGASCVTPIHSVYQYLLSACYVQGKELVSALEIQQYPNQMKFSPLWSSHSCQENTLNQDLVAFGLLALR